MHPRRKEHPSNRQLKKNKAKVQYKEHENCTHEEEKTLLIGNKKKNKAKVQYKEHKKCTHEEKNTLVIGN